MSRLPFAGGPLTCQGAGGGGGRAIHPCSAHPKVRGRGEHPTQTTDPAASRTWAALGSWCLCHQFWVPSTWRWGESCPAPRCRQSTLPWGWHTCQCHHEQQCFIPQQPGHWWHWAPGSVSVSPMFVFLNAACAPTPPEPRTVRQPHTSYSGPHPGFCNFCLPFPSMHHGRLWLGKRDAQGCQLSCPPCMPRHGLPAAWLPRTPSLLQEPQAETQPDQGYVQPERL